MSTENTPLVGKLLIAMPEMSDPRFAQTVIFMCAHSDEGGMGLIVNKGHGDLTLADLFEQLDMASPEKAPRLPVRFGGPVEGQRGFVLHTDDYAAEDGTLDVDQTFRMTATLQILEDIAAGQGPSKALVALGYAGWGPGQLEYEIAQNGWLVCDPDPTLIFAENDSEKWVKALGLMGIDPLLLSASAGRA